MPEKKVSEEETTNKKRDLNIALNKGVLGFARNWAFFISLLIGIYAGLPWVAPIAMNVGMTGVGEAIYTIYGPFCHQFTFRSWLIGGEQAAYPRARAGSPNFEPFEATVGTDPFFRERVDDITELDNDLIFAARAFRGNEQYGYKTALCQRDLAIYAMLAIAGFGMAFLFKSGLKVPYLPFWAYILIAIAPIGLDGFSQLFANPPFNGFGIAFYPIRESTPFLRSFTGALFGFGNAWLAYPYVEDSMKETVELVERKLRDAGELEDDTADVGV